MDQPADARAILEAFCDLEPAEAWDAFRAIASDHDQPEHRRVRAAAWLAIANAVSALGEREDDEPA